MNTNKALAVTFKESIAVLARFVDKLSELLGHGQITSMIYDEATHSLISGPGCEAFPEIFQDVLNGTALGVGCCGNAALGSKSVIVDDTRSSTLWRPFLWAGEQAGIRSVWSIPIQFEDRLYGTFDIYHKEIYTPDTREIQIAEWVAEHTAVVLQNVYLKKSEEYYRSLFNNHPDMLFTVDRAGDFVSVNSAGSSITGYSTNELLGKSVMELPNEEDIHRLLEQFHAALKGYISQIQISLTRKDGNFAKLEISCAPVVVQGEMLGMYGVARDVNEQARLQDTLTHVTQIAKIGIWDWDIRSNEVHWSDETYRIFGVQEHTLELTRELILAFVHDEERIIVEQALQKCLHGKPLDIQHRIHITDGKQKTLHVQGNAIFDNDGKPVRLVGIVRDITESKLEQERSLENEQRKSEKLSVIGQLAAGVAHEIRNPLTTVKGFIQLLKVSSQVETKDKYIQIVQTELNRIEHIVDEFLIFAKPQATEFTFCNLTTILDDVINLMDAEAIMNNVEIVTNIESGIPMIRCEVNRLQQVFVNVIKNAIEAMPTGGRVLVVLRTDGERVIIEITDQGHGIEEDRLKTITEPFYTTKEKGTGLGLMISQKIIEAHAGVLEITSKVNEGTTVKVALPVS